MKSLKYLQYLSLIAEAVERVERFLLGESYTTSATVKTNGRKIRIEVKATVIETDDKSGVPSLSPR